MKKNFLVSFKKVRRLKRRNINISPLSIDQIKLWRKFNKIKNSKLISPSTDLTVKNITTGLFGQHIIIYAKKNYRITEEQIKAINTDLITPKGLTEGKLIKDFKIKITIVPNKVLTKKGILVRMGKGKGKIKTYAKYLTEGTICIELRFKSKKLSLNLVQKILKKFIKKYTFLSYKFII